jgi:hypothetical protein
MTAVRNAVFNLLLAAIALGGAFALSTTAGVDLGFIGESVTDGWAQITEEVRS